MTSGHNDGYQVQSSYRCSLKAKPCLSAPHGNIDQCYRVEASVEVRYNGWQL